MRMRYKYSNDFIGAIIKVLLIKQKLTFNKLYEELIEALRHTKSSTSKYTPSRTQFALHVKKLVDEGYLERIEDKNSKRKIKSVYYSLKDKAKKEYQFDLLQNERRRKLYQFLFLFQVFSSLKQISAKQFDEILSRIPLSRNDLYSRQEGAFYLPFSFSPSERYFNRPLERLGSTQHFPIVEHLCFSAVYNPSLYVRQLKRGLGKTSYYCKLLSFSLRDLMEYMKNARAKRPEHDFFSVPFLNEMSFSEEGLGRELNTLREANLIKPIRNVFDPDGDLRLVLSDDSLEEITNKIWTIFTSQLDTVLLNINYLQKPGEKETDWLHTIFGKRKADNIINDAYESRRSFKKKGRDETLSYDEKKSYVKGFVEAINKAKTKNQTILKKYYRENIRENAFPVDLIGEVLFEKDFFSYRK